MIVLVVEDIHTIQTFKKCNNLFVRETDLEL